MVGKFWILFDMIASIVLFVLISVLTTLLLYKIKLKLNFSTKCVFYLNMVALGLRMFFSVWQYCFDTFKMTTGKQYFIFACEAVCFCFYLYNVSRVIASWMLID